MSATDRQNKLLLAEDWQTIYQSFKYADFKSYDFDTLRRTMINYIRLNYPEDFSDYIESSEYLALIDLIAFLGQNISFRTDLNARENFIELAERRESVLRLARLISYNPTRTQPANGLLKITSLQTSENIIDSNGTNLSSRNIRWNDSVNDNWFEQFIKVLNSSLTQENRFGTPRKAELVAGIRTEKYNVDSRPDVFPVFAFNKNINGKSLPFEVVSTDIADGEIIEDSPSLGKKIGMLYRDNGQGAGSANSGFFMHFRQGTLQKAEFTVSLPTPNQTIGLESSSINNQDIWLYQLDSNQVEQKLWTKVDAVEGNNVIYNSVAKGVRDVYAVQTRTDDRVNLIFSDGVFGELPKGNFRAFYRTSENSDYTITPNEISNIKLNIPYVSASGSNETLIVQLSLKQTVNNAASSESTDSIKQNAPSTYYTQNRLITGEDYNIGPLGISQDIIKTKAINRTSSGINRYYDLRDSTGKYSTTNLFGTDGILYKEYLDIKYNFSFQTKTDIEATVENLVTEIIADNNTKNFFADQFLDQDYTDLDLAWQQQTKETNTSTGFLLDNNQLGDADPQYYSVGTSTQGPLRFLQTNALVKFVAPSGSHFMPDGTIMSGPANHAGSRTYIWTKVVAVRNTGSELDEATNTGPIIFSDIIPSGALLTKVKIKYTRDILTSIKQDIIDQVFAYRTFGLRYDRELRNWFIITQDNINIKDSYNIGLTGDTAGQNLDRSWILLFETNGIDYTITVRTLRYIFESNEEIRFYYDNNKKIYDSKTGKIVRDKISVLNINTDLASAGQTSPFTIDFDWAISKEYRDDIGYVNSKKVEVVFFDEDDDGIVDNPQIFDDIVSPDTVPTLEKYVFTKKYTEFDTEYYRYISQSSENIIVVNSYRSINASTVGNPVYYVVETDSFWKVTTATRTIAQVFDYKSFVGRDNLKFQYIHASDENARIDPASSNIMDTYILTRQYDSQFRQFLKGEITNMPYPASSDQLYRSYGKEINKIKSISDEVIFHPVQYKVLFGTSAETNLQATFKVVKNKNRVVNDNDVKGKVIDAINEFFSLENWDFGETFYWSELSAYIVKQLSPDLVSIVLVPVSGQSSFGSLFEVKSESNEILISGATVSNVEIITAITADRLKSEGNIITSVTATGEVIQSAAETVTSTTSTVGTSTVGNSNTGGSSY